MLMPVEVVAQIHRLSRQANAKKHSRLLTHVMRIFIAVLYTSIKTEEYGVNPAHAYGVLTGVDREDKDNTTDKDYNSE